MGRLVNVEHLKKGIWMMNENSGRARKPRDVRRKEARSMYLRKTYYVYTTKDDAKKSKNPAHTFIAKTAERAAERSAVRMRSKQQSTAYVGKILYVRRAKSKTVSAFKIKEIKKCTRRWVAQSTETEFDDQGQQRYKYSPPPDNQRDFRGSWRAKVEFVEGFQRDPFKRDSSKKKKKKKTTTRTHSLR
jgi:hypothetical protein